MAASENDDDEAQQIQQDRTLALELQVQENIGFATAQRQQVTEEHATFHEASFATTETDAALRDERAQFRAANQEAHLRDDIYSEMSSASAVAGVSSLASRGEEQEDDFDNESFHLVSSHNSSDMSSGVLLSDEDKKSHLPNFMSNEDADSSNKRSSDISSYAAVASSAQRNSSELNADGVGVIASVAHLREESSTTQNESHAELARTQVRRGAHHEYYYDIRHYENGDKIFQALFGEYGDIDPLPVNIKPRHKKDLATNPTVRMEVSRSITLQHPTSDPKLQLEQYCTCLGSNIKPEYQRFDLTGPIRDRTFQTVVQHPLWESTVFIGEGKTQQESEMVAARRALASLLDSFQVADRAKDLTISFRAAAAKLPFCLRFQLERSILSDSPERIPLKMKKDNGDSALSHLIYLTRAMMLIYIQVILPPLLKIDWMNECVGEGTFTLIELFAEELWESLVEVKQAIKMGKQVNFQGKVQELLCRARLTLHHAQNVCDTTEMELSSNGETGQDGYVETIRKRSLWPVAMYSCKFDLDGNLVPNDFQVLNKDPQKFKFVQPQTRRVMREAGWSVRDRFVKISSVRFHGIFQEKLADWLEANPKLCNREYEFLIDKGVGKPTIWMYAPPKEEHGQSLSRDSLLKSLGCFDDVAVTKIGDRISLAFTQTTPIDEIPLHCILAEPELVGNGYQYSDGCGVMGRGIARKVQEVLMLQELPGAIQIRMGGVKGMLSYKHDYPENKIGIRPSMVKFRSNHRMLEVKQHAYINENPPLFSQLILIMHYQGVPNRILLELQAKACAEMAREYDTTTRNKGDTVQYIQRVVKHGRKQNGRSFSPYEFEELRRMMVESKTRVNLQCDALLMYGVIDEHGILEEGQVLVSNGTIQGPVLISRSPCLMPGDIQKVIAIPGINAYSELNDVVVFSSKGSRPLADCLGGGDLDGDQFYIIYEKDIVENMYSAEAHDYGSQSPDVKITMDVQDCFRVVDPCLPAVKDQLEVFRKLLCLGDIVSWSSDAWLRVVDIEGPGSIRATSMADLCQHALDARKLAIQIDDSQIRAMNQIRREMETPHWRSVGQKCRQSNSILGILYNIWDSWIRDLEAASRRRLRDYRGYHGVDASLDESQSQLEMDTVASFESECIICAATGIMQCSFCGETVWICSDQCKQWHESEAGHTHGSIDTYDASTLKSFSTSCDSSMLMCRPLDVLLDVIFGRKRPLFNGDKAIDFRSLNEIDLVTLSEMVLMEFLECMLEEDIKRPRTSNNSPRVNDVFRMHGGELAVYRPLSDGKDLVWFDKDNKPMPSTAMPYQRVASMSGTLRTLESLLAKPAAGSLMEQAMKRNIVQVTPNTEMIDLNLGNIDYLNKSQLQVVKTVLKMKRGIICVQGPPGCGKSSTLVEIVSAIGGGIIVTAPSNAAVANLALKILSTGQFSTREIVVWGENCEASVRFLNPAHRQRRWSSFRRDYFNLGDEKEAEKRKMRHELASWLQMDRATLAQMASLARKDADDDSDDGLKVAASAKVLLCTLNTAGSTRLRNAVKLKFDLMLLDEGSQSPEAEFYIATTFPGVRRIVVVGDPKQLPSTVTHNGCEKAGYGDSFLSHVLEFQPEKVHLLDVQYRMEPEILAFSNEMFYSGRIRSDENVLNRKPRLKLPFAVVDTSGFGRDVEQPVHSSWKNECEANVIKSILCNDEDVRRVQSAVVGARTIVITPYKAQQRFLQNELKKIKTLHRHDISTVDSFQGQEGDIVIVSTVRTNSVGFTDNPNRLNVALTRGKRVVRVIGNLEFFNKVSGEASVLRSLAAFAKQHDIVKAMSVSTAWKPPDWTKPRAWKPTMTARFHECLKPTNMKRMDKNVAFNTLLTICTPRLGDLTNPPTEHGPPRWQTSSLRKYDEQLQIVWIAKELEQNCRYSAAPYRGVVEAHFSGKRVDCLKFIQKNFLVPRNTCRVKRDMSAIIPSKNEAATHATDIELSWEVTNDIQEAVMDDNIQELPLGLFMLDEDQESILALSPPLLIESRSGMGKTEILFKHSISYYPSGQTSRTCFVTVSANLYRSLQRRYCDVQEVKDVLLPSISFFSFLGSRVQTETGTETVRSLVSILLGIYRIPETEISVSSSCTFWEYVRSKKSHERSEVDLALVENEIGGVILGSLAAAVNQKALSRFEYLEEQRSNVPKDTGGLRTRGMVYDEFEKYRQWKVSNDRYDTGDIVLRLVREASEQGLKEIFHSVYLDEVQDFSYADLYLICSIAGKNEGRWVAAGDTAQMISPGCSFTFKGLKDTFLAIRHGIELRKEVKLKRNYRMNRGTLEMANAVILLIKQHFPKAIESYQKEEAVKDLGLKVALLDWEKAIGAENPSFGVEQAIIYGSDIDLEAVHDSMNEWLNNHPFILSSLDSKGLEFDDVIVALTSSVKRGM